MTLTERAKLTQTADKLQEAGYPLQAAQFRRALRDGDLKTVARILILADRAGGQMAETFREAYEG